MERAFQRSLSILRRHDTNRLGLVLNDVDLSQRGDEYTYDYRAYGHAAP